MQDRVGILSHRRAFSTVVLDFIGSARTLYTWPSAPQFSHFHQQFSTAFTPNSPKLNLKTLTSYFSVIVKFIVPTLLLAVAASATDLNLGDLIRAGGTLGQKLQCAVQCVYDSTDKLKCSTTGGIIDGICDNVETIRRQAAPCIAKCRLASVYHGKRTLPLAQLESMSSADIISYSSGSCRTMFSAHYPALRDAQAALSLRLGCDWDGN